MDANYHFTISSATGAPYEFDLSTANNTNDLGQIKIGEKYYSIQAKNEEELSSIQEMIKNISRGKPIQSIEDLSQRISSLDAASTIQASHVHQVGIVTLQGDSPLSDWSKQDRQIKQKVAQLYWEKKVAEDPEYSEKTHKGFIDYLRLNAFYDPTIDNQEDRLVEKILLAIKKGNLARDEFLKIYDPTIDNHEDKPAKKVLLAIKKGNLARDEFLKIFENLPLGIVEAVDQGEGLNASPPLPAINSEKKSFKESDLEQLQQYMKEINFSGVVCLSDSKRAYLFSSGNISSEKTSFAVHSIGKAFTGMLAMKLIQENILSEAAMDQPIQLNLQTLSKLPPQVQEFLTGNNAPTFRQIMLHRSGLGDYVTAYTEAIQHAIDNQEEIPKVQSPEDFLKYAENEIYDLKEGEERYSNLGILLVGLSLQHLHNLQNPNSKKTYQEILENFIIGPAGLTSFRSTRPEDSSYNERHLAAAYIEGGPAGGYWMTPTDLLKFGEWSAKECQDKNFHEIVKKYGGEFSPEEGELSHGGAIESSSAFWASFLPNGINVAIASNRPHQAYVIMNAIKSNILAK